MSTKNLSRAIIQGGRTNSNKWQRRYSTKVERRKVKRYVEQTICEANEEILHPRLDFELGVIVIEIESVGGNLVMPVRTRVQPEFNDHLGPLNRWLSAQVGKDWEEVWHKLCHFDRDSIAGRHLVNDHARGQIIDVGDDHKWAFQDTLVVDENGQFCRASDFESSHIWNKRWENADKKSDQWANGRKVVDQCGKLYWKEGDILTAMSEEDGEFFQMLTGHSQRALKGYHRFSGGKRRKNRTLPSLTKYVERQRELGRKGYV